MGKKSNNKRGDRRKAEGISEERRRIVVAKYAKGYLAVEIAEFLEIGLKEVKDIITAIRA